MQLLTRFVSVNTVTRNGVANVFNGAANWAPIVLIPYFMSAVYAANEISIWAISVQVISYITFLALGVQTAISRYVAYYARTKDTELANLVHTAHAYLRVACLLGVVGVGMFLLLLDRAFPQAPGGSSLVVVFIALTGCLQVLASGYAAIFIGDQRNEFPAFINSVYRLLQVLALYLAIQLRQPLEILASIYLAFTVVGTLMHVIAFRWAGYPTRFRQGEMDRDSAQLLWNYCYPIVVWQFGLLMITGTDIFIISWLDFEYGASYAMASSLTMAIAGFTGAMSTPLIQASAELKGQDNTEQVLAMLRRYSIFYAAFGLLIWLLVLFLGRTLVEWVYGAAYVDRVFGFLSLLTLAAVIRSICAPYTAVVMGYEMQNKILLSPAVEGIANVVFSLGLGLVFGVYGVVWGSVIGAAIGVGFHFLYNMRITRPVTLLGANST